MQSSFNGSLRHMPVGSRSIRKITYKEIQRWDGINRAASDWNCLHRDPELWDPRGNCLVFLYAPGQSQRGAAYRLSSSLLASAGCFPLLELSPISSTRLENSKRQTHHLYLSSPSGLDYSEIFQYHLTTRNFFAVILDIPLVGVDPASAILKVKKRMDIWRDADLDNIKAIFNYIHRQGYADSPKPALKVESRRLERPRVRCTQRNSMSEKPLPPIPDEPEEPDCEAQFGSRSRPRSSDSASITTSPVSPPSLDSNCESPVSSGSPESPSGFFERLYMLPPEQVRGKNRKSGRDSNKSFASDFAGRTNAIGGFALLSRDTDQISPGDEDNGIYVFSDPVVDMDYGELIPSPQKPPLHSSGHRHSSLIETVQAIKSFPRANQETDGAPEMINRTPSHLIRSGYSSKLVAIGDDTQFDPDQEDSPIDWFLEELEEGTRGVSSGFGSSGSSLGILSAGLGWD